MKIESLIKRKGGTVVELDAPSRTYRFAPESGNHDDPHVAEVEEQSHARALLRIREGYRVLPGEELPEDEQQQLKQQGQDLVGSNIHSASYVIKGGDSIALDDLIAMAFEDSGLDHDQWNSATDEERYGYIDATLLELQVGAVDDDAMDVDRAQAARLKQADEEVAAKEAAKQEKLAKQAAKQEAPAPAAQENTDSTEEPELKALPRKDLVALYQKRFGRQPSTRMTIDDIANALSEED